MITMPKIRNFLKTKGFDTKEARAKITEVQLQELATAFKTEFGEDFVEALASASAKNEPTFTADQINQIKTSLQSMEEILAAGEPDTKNDDEPPVPSAEGSAAPQASEPTQVVATVNKMATTMAQMANDIKILAGNPEPAKPTTMEAKVIPINSGISTPKYLFGIEHPYFDRSKPWNEVSASRQPLDVIGAHTGMDVNWKKHEATLLEEINNYTSSLANRVNALQDEGRLSSIKMAEVDFAGFTGTGWGDAYVVRRQDAIIAYIRSLRNVGTIFPVRYGVQNKMVMTNSFLTEFSQAYQKGKIFKGGYEFQPMEAHVSDVMFKHNYENLKKLEKEYLGYLNREGSQPIKWSFLEWLIVNTMVQLQNEWNQRRIQGYRVEPVVGTAGHHLFGSDGVLATLQKYVDEYYLQPYADFNKYTPSTILAHVEAFTEAVNMDIPTLSGYYLYVNEKHVPWYLQANREKYGQKLDFNGVKLSVQDYNLAGIIPVPNMRNDDYRMFITLENNIELYENLPGEMAQIYFQRDLEDILGSSWWVEGSGAYLVGKKFATLAELVASNRKSQFIFLTDPRNVLDEDATTADAADGTVHETSANSGAKALTDITNAEEGVVYTIRCGATANATTIAKAAKFSELTAAWIPTAVGDYLRVYYNSTTSKFMEIERRVTA